MSPSIPASNASSAAAVKSAQKKSFDALTGLRFFAAIGVVLYHFAGPIAAQGPRVFAHCIASGFVAVSFFYVLSGFVLAYSYIDRGGEMLGSRRSFWVARFARIYPAYFLAFLLAAPFNILWTLRVNHLSTAVAKLVTGAVSVLTLQQAWTPWTAWYWNFPAWSVSVEAFFYLAFPFLVPFLKKASIRSCLAAAGALWITSLIPPILLCLVHGSGAGQDRWQMAVEFTPILRLPEFVMGLVLGRAYVLGLRGTPKLNKMLSYASLLAIFACLAASAAIPRPLLAGGALAPLFAVLIFSLADGNGLPARFFSLSFLVLLGDASYGIYILQIPVAYLLGVPPPLYSPRVLAIYLAVLIVGALLSWRFVESPMRLRIRHWLGVHKPSSPRAVSEINSKDQVLVFAGRRQ